jgi:DNA polymerase-4
MRALDRLWKERPEPRSPVLQVGVMLTRLCEKGNFTPELFQSAIADVMAGNDEKHQRLDATIDKLRVRYGRSVVYFGSVQDSRETAPMRISFTHIPDLEVEKD